MKEGKIPLDICVNTFKFFLRLILNIAFAVLVSNSWVPIVSLSNTVSKLKALHPRMNT